MLRDSRSGASALAAALAVALATTACGIKGPLTPAKQPEAEAAKDSGKTPAAPKL